MAKAWVIGFSPLRRCYYPESVISVMLIIAFIFEQMFCRFEGAMGLDFIPPFLAMP